MRERFGSGEIPTEEMERQLKERKLADRNKEREKEFEHDKRALEAHLLSMDNEAFVENVLSASFEAPDPNYDDEYSDEEEYTWEEAELEREWDEKFRKMRLQVYTQVLNSRLK